MNLKLKIKSFQNKNIKNNWKLNKFRLIKKPMEIKTLKLNKINYLLKVYVYDQ